MCSLEMMLFEGRASESICCQDALTNATIKKYLALFQVTRISTDGKSFPVRVLLSSSENSDSFLRGQSEDGILQEKLRSLWLFEESAEVHQQAYEGKIEIPEAISSKLHEEPQSGSSREELEEEVIA